jgi:hypothetical protein
MKNKYFLYLSLTLCLLSAGCRKYVEIDQEQQRVLKLTSDYQALLYNTTTMDKSYNYPVYSSEDVGADTATWQNNLSTTNGSVYTWSAKIVASTDEDNDWYNMYSQMYICNTIISNVMNSEGGTDAEKRKALASALVHRAYNYYTLVNIYGKQYDSTTASTDLGVPMRLDDAVTGSLVRVPVQTVYNQILSDLNAALPDLPSLPDYNTNASKAAAFAILSRTYLNMRKFTEAERFADSTLSLQYALINLNTYLTSFTGYPQKQVNPELIFSKIATGVVNLPVSPAQLALFTGDDSTDLRYKLYTKKGSDAGYAYLPRVYYKQRIVGQGIYTGPTVPEIMLIKAECEARAGNASTAISILNTLRKQRFTAATYKDLTATTADKALQTVLLERKKELMGTGLHWFDQRRLAKDGFTPTITRIFKGTTYTLESGSNRYLFAIGDKYILLNPEIEQNPR